MKKQKTSGNPKKIRAILFLIPLVIVHLLLDFFYRPMAYSYSFNDFGFKDSFTQLTAVPGISFLMILFEKDDTWSGTTGKIFLVIIPVMAMLMYEAIQPFISKSTFDQLDILYTLLGGLANSILQFKIMR
ncbi:hypothetical protein [Cyclobacterium xiamenense]|uniref:hypothetical protein n=1 Tax=Cyclobacterium xiamenense TaxID=1297121 RepID=UPI0035D07E7B